ncbi:DUF4421 family protein [Winogradskyella endarachnes]|uniref:DUF4421 domain-containing protein n=1 Tax=Winogradskyella endarachnes TaxID=2681965 RepID=A0A6L6U8E0_9FLAO|nr:DUF4421 family protein [Winogradskyella endarachnes]MUU78289.1 DUF4421 domain-containing protein [Winogradskyella endarachnes]
MLKILNIKKTLALKLFISFTCSLLYITAHAQDMEGIDDLLLDRDIDNYSFRVFTNFKANKFSILSETSKARFAPNNRHGLGLGIANRKIILDLAFNIKKANKEATKKFDIQGTTIIKRRHYTNLYFQSYKGFTAKNNFDVDYDFRSNMRSLSFGINYLYTFNDIEFSYALLKAGLEDNENKNVLISGGIGLFSGFNYFSANSGILTEDTSLFFNDQANIRRFQGVTVGVLAGLISYFKLPENITATVNIMPGMGVMYKKLTIEGGSYTPSNPMIYKLDFMLGLGYNFDRFYISLTYNNGLYTTDFDYSNRYRLNVTNAKLAIGYRFKS